MSSSDIYQIKESPWAKREKKPAVQRRHRTAVKSFDEAHEVVSKSHNRRHRNRGFRRFLHLMKKPEFSKKFWTITLTVFSLLIGSIVVWDLFFRYPKELPEFVPASIPSYEQLDG